MGRYYCGAFSSPAGHGSRRSDLEGERLRCDGRVAPKEWVSAKRTGFSYQCRLRSLICEAKRDGRRIRISLTAVWKATLLGRTGLRLRKRARCLGVNDAAG